MNVNYLSLTVLMFLSVQTIKGLSSEDVANFRTEIEPIKQRIVDVNNLVYGANCSASNENKRQDVVKRILKSLSTESHDDTEIYLSDLKELLTEISEIPGPFCNTADGLQCNSAGTCDCLDSDSYGINLKLVIGKQSCFIADGSVCAYEDFLNSRNPLVEGIPQSHYECRGGEDDCILKSTGEICSLSNANKEFVKILANLNGSKVGLSNPTEFMLKHFKDGMCVCKNKSSIGMIPPNMPSLQCDSGVWPWLLLVICLALVIASFVYASREWIRRRTGGDKEILENAL